MRPSNYLRVKNTDVFALYTGADNEARKSLYVKLIKKPTTIRKSKYIEADIQKRSDHRFGLTISLQDERYRGVFDAFVQDLFDAIKNEDNELLAEDKFLKRLDLWWALFTKRAESVLSFERIVGLMGELNFLAHYIIPEYGPSTGLKSWSGPLGSDQDFSLGEVWYEIKTKSLDKPTVHISNANQLSDSTKGFLVVSNYKKTSPADSKGTSLMKIYTELCQQIDDPGLVTQFNKLLAMVGFVPKKIYEEIVIQFKQINFYTVADGFPKVVVDDKQSAISRIEYDLDVKGLSMYKVEDANVRLPRRFN